MPRARRPYMQWLARAGYAARGLVFMILAYFTAVAAFDAHRQPIDGMDAFRSVLTAPLGSVLLAFITAGLLCFAFWREAQSVFDVDRYGSNAMGLARRTVYGAAGLFYAGFATVSLSMLIGAHTNTTEQTIHDWTRWLLGQPFGQVAVGAIGVSIMIAGLCIGVAGVRAQFRKRIVLKAEPRRLVTALGCAGYLTRSALISLIGLFLVFAALHSNAHEATGLAGALMIIKSQRYGGAILGATALGLLAFGAYGVAEALYRRIDGRRPTMRLAA
jgi:uncharacterized protein DUF1206